MRWNKDFTPSRTTIGKQRINWRQRGAGAVYLGAVALAACGPSAPRSAPELPKPQDLVGGIVAEEPRAAFVGRDILAAGGNAADAAVATYLALAVTYPGAAGLAGGGACVVYDAPTGRVEALEFLPAAPAAGGAVAVPGNVRGIGLLHARYGRLRWATVVAPAEQLAQLGHRVSRAHVQAFAAVPPDAGAGLRDFARQENETWRQPDLATVLARIRVGGAAELAVGAAARSYVAAANQLGGKLTLDDMAGAPAVAAPARAAFGTTTLLFAPTAGAAVAARLWEASVRPGTWVGGGGLARARLGEAMAGGHAGLDSASPATDGATTAFAALDRDGQAVACAVTMGRIFGLRQVAGRTGVVLAPAPPKGGYEVAAVALVAANLTIGNTYAAATATGGAPAASALVQAAAPALLEQLAPEPAIAAPRLFLAGSAGTLWHEPKIDPGALRDAGKAGAGRQEIIELGRVGLLHCPGGVPRGPATCRFAHDQRGYGLALGQP